MADDTLALQQLDEKSGKPPEKSRVGSAMAIRSRIKDMRRNDQKRASNRRKIQRLIDGARPYDQALLEARGQGDRTNFNPREAEGMADAAKTPFYAVRFRSSRFTNIQCDYGDNLARRAEWSETISESFHRMLDEWDEHDYNSQLYQWQMCVFGVGIPMWLDDKDWRWEPRKIGDVSVPDRCPSNIKKWTECAIQRVVNPVDLWKLIENEKAAKTMGWFPERVKKALVKAAPVDLRSASGFGDVWSEEYQSSLRRGDIVWSGSTAEILVEDYLAREFDGRITHCIVLSDGGQATPDGKEDEGLLFKKVGRYECFEQVLCPFYFDIGTGEHHSVKGLGPKIFDFCMVSARTLCDMVDGARRASGLLLEAVDANAMETTQTITIAGATVVQPGFKVVQQRLGENMEGVLEVRREMSGILQSNTGQYRERVALENQEPTLGQAQLNMRNQESLSESSMDRYCKRLDRLDHEVLRRAMPLGLSIYKKRHKKSGVEMPEKYAQEDEGKELAYWFVRRCIEQGVPEEALDMDYICSVKASRGLGSGSPAAMDMATQGLLQLAPMFDERGKTNALRRRTAFFAGQGNVDEFVLPFNEQETPGEEAQKATNENNALRNIDGEALPIFSDNHPIHFGIHYADAAQHIEHVQQGQGDPIQLLTHLHQAGVHMKAHLDGMANDPSRKNQYEQMNKAWLMLSKMADKLQQNLEEAAKAQQSAQPQQQPQVDPAMAAAMAKVAGELSLKKQKQDGEMMLKADKQAFTKRIKDLETAHKMRLLNYTTTAQTAADGAQQQETPPTKVIETISYKDAPPSIRRQIERQQGFEPATETEESPLSPEPAGAAAS